MSAAVPTIFLSTFCNKIDKKGRVSVPASFRTILSLQSFQGFVAFCSLNAPAIEGFGMDRMERLSQRIDQSFDVFSQEQDDWSSLFAQAQPLSFDSEGRITLTPEMCQHAAFEDTVAFVGRGPTFQLWNPKAYQEHQQKARQRLVDKKGMHLGSLSVERRDEP